MVTENVDVLNCSLTFELFPILQSDQITVTEIKEEDYMEDVADSCQQETLSTEGKRVHEFCMPEYTLQIKLLYTFIEGLCVYMQQNMKKVFLRNQSSCPSITWLVVALAVCHLNRVHL